MVGRIRFALERSGSPRHSSHVAQLFSLGGSERTMTNWRKVYWRLRNALLTFGAEGGLGKLGAFVSPVLVAGVVVSGLSVVFVLSSGFGSLQGRLPPGDGFGFLVSCSD